MDCPLKNQKLLETLMGSPDCSFSQEHPSPYFSPNPHYTQPGEGEPHHEHEKEESELQRYLLGDAEEQPAEEEDRNDYSFELSELRDKLISIEEISQKEIARLNQELQQERAKRQPVQNERVSVGVNTEPDHRNEEIAVLKEMLKQQSLLNRQLLKEACKDKENIYQNIKITKN